MIFIIFNVCVIFSQVIEINQVNFIELVEYLIETSLYESSEEKYLEIIKEISDFLTSKITDHKHFFNITPLLNLKKIYFNYFFNKIEYLIFMYELWIEKKQYFNEIKLDSYIKAESTKKTLNSLHIDLIRKIDEFMNIFSSIKMNWYESNLNEFLSSSDANINRGIKQLNNVLIKLDIKYEELILRIYDFITNLTYLFLFDSKLNFNKQLKPDDISNYFIKEKIFINGVIYQNKEKILSYDLNEDLISLIKQNIKIKELISKTNELFSFKNEYTNQNFQYIIKQTQRMCKSYDYIWLLSDFYKTIYGEINILIEKTKMITNESKKSSWYILNAKRKILKRATFLQINVKFLTGKYIPLFNMFFSTKFLHQSSFFDQNIDSPNENIALVIKNLHNKLNDMTYFYNSFNLDEIKNNFKLHPEKIIAFKNIMNDIYAYNEQKTYDYKKSNLVKIIKLYNSSLDFFQDFFTKIYNTDNKLVIYESKNIFLCASNKLPKFSNRDHYEIFIKIKEYFIMELKTELLPLFHEKINVLKQPTCKKKIINNNLRIKYLELENISNIFNNTCKYTDTTESQFVNFITFISELMKKLHEINMLKIDFCKQSPDFDNIAHDDFSSELKTIQKQKNKENNPEFDFEATKEKSYNFKKIFNIIIILIYGILLVLLFHILYKMKVNKYFNSNLIIF